MVAYFKNFKSYHLITHSFGSYIAMKIAEKLESDGINGTLTFIDAAPALFKNLMSSRYQRSIYEESQNDTIKNVSRVVCTKPLDLSSVFELSSWDEKVDKFLSLVSDQQQYEKEYLRKKLNTFYNRLLIVFNTENKVCSSFLKSSITLIRPTIPWVANMSEKYDLQVDFKEEVKLLYLEGNHTTVLENPLLIDIIHKQHSELENLRLKQN